MWGGYVKCFHFGKHCSAYYHSGKGAKWFRVTRMKPHCENNNCHCHVHPRFFIELKRLDICIW